MVSHATSWLLGLSLLLVPWAASQAAEIAQGQRGMVVCESGEATTVGLEVLREGGNAVDATIATAFAMAVTFPQAGNIGGGGFMMVHPGTGSKLEKPVQVDYREVAPGAATPTMFELGESRLTQKAVGVPGTVRGLWLAHEKYGKLPWKRLVSPAVKLAEEGFAVTPYLAGSLNRVLAEADEGSELVRVFGKPGDDPVWREGDRLRQPDLAGTLRLIAEEGPAAFYEGKIAEQIVAEMQRGNGLISADDLKNYRALMREPVRGKFRGYDIYGAAPPSSGGTCVIEALNITEALDLRQYERFSPEAMHLMTETLRRVFYERAKYLGDPAFTDIPPFLTRTGHAREWAASIPMYEATRSVDLARDIKITAEGTDTTHISVMDASGMAVANTYTLERSWGAQVVVRGAGFLLNNEMGDFNWKPGYTDTRGHIGTKPNVIAPGKRMLSSMSPTIAAKDGRAVIVTGSPGGRTIISTVYCMLVNLLEYEMPLKEAVEAPRLHHGWLPDVLLFEGIGSDGFAELLADLKRRGHHLAGSGHSQGAANTIRLDVKSGTIYGAADGRRQAVAAGF